MQALVILAIMFAIGALGVGYLSNDFVAVVQQFGVGSGIIPNPVMGTDLTLQIQRVQKPGGFDDLITQCNFTSIDVNLPTGTKLFCKLYEGRNIKTSNVFAEGSITLNAPVPAGMVIEIPITVFVFPNSNDVDYVHNAAVLVQTPTA